MIQATHQFPFPTEGLKQYSGVRPALTVLRVQVRDEQDSSGPLQ